MVANGQASILTGHPQESLYAGVMIVITVVAFNVLGDRLATSLLRERPMTPLLHIDDLHVELPVGDEMRPVIHDTTLSVDDGEALGLVGESGAGKSMTIRAICGSCPPVRRSRARSSSTAATCSTSAAKELRRFLASDAAMIFQDPSTHINPVRTIGDFLDRGPGHEQRDGGGRGAAAGEGHPRGRRHRGRGATTGPVPARALRRAAAAGHDRRRPGDQAAAAARRRADDLARRDDAGRGDGDPRRAASRARSDHDLRHPRPGAGRRGLRPHRRDVRGLPGRGHAAPPPCTRRPAHPYTQGTARVATEPDRDGRAALRRSRAGRSRPSRSEDGCAVRVALPLSWKSAAGTSGRSCASSTAGGCAATAPTSCATGWRSRRSAARSGVDDVR